ncbi:hypothetical protein [Rhizobium sp. MHM7A]|uniref:hypothetical protein n=1 Tax=Rhizobium sp. MHM7A TaxID=2583233 RepID=UPI001106EEE9|nr:hypothetical protein [Rhizobium sp. MHM7A]TLX16561.1 hypothetical protein FFR93_04275 [Rhizobium sp. MHM7A]
MKGKLDGAKADKRAKALQRYKSELGKLHGLKKKVSELRYGIKRLSHDLHQHKRRLETLRQKLKKGSPGSKIPQSVSDRKRCSRRNSIWKRTALPRMRNGVLHGSKLATRRSSSKAWRRLSSETSSQG